MKVSQDSKRLEQLSDKLYKKYGKPLEGEHWGEFLAVSQKGKTILGETLLEVAQKASSILGLGNFIFKVGEKAVGKWR
ncbi:MAG: hypothetical protein G01um10147_254 [Microgenomates group bacterium Gr01-1014_7]|nr:MAG: hypothetical protein G01um10147_254 [Microgenomates group bacterium Gr01-1014_7]